MALSPEASTKKFGKFVDHLHEKQYISSQQRDDSKRWYNKFLNDVVEAKKESFSIFDSNVIHVDQFLGTFLNDTKEVKSLRLICKFVFTLPH